MDVLRDAASRTTAPVWVVIDALDEAQPGTIGAARLPLPEALAPDGVYVVLTYRPGPYVPRLRAGTATVVDELILDAASQRQEADLREFLDDQVQNDKAVAAGVARVEAWLGGADLFVDTMLDRSDGDFAYATYVLDDLRNGRELSELPEGLAGYYNDMWDVIGPGVGGDFADWDTLVGQSSNCSRWRASP